MARSPDIQPELMTGDETVSYLRLDVGSDNPRERLRNLVRRQGLPCIKRGRLLLFRRVAVDAWLDGVRTVGPARLVGAQRVTSKNGAALHRRSAGTGDNSP